MAEEYDLDKAETSFVEFLTRNLLKTLDENTYFTIPQKSIIALDLLPKLRLDYLPDLQNPATTTSRSDSTVYSVLNKCRTVGGQRLIAIWLSNPLKSKEKIDLRLDIVQCFMDNTILRLSCYDSYLKKVPDLLRVAHKISKQKCTLSDLVRVYFVCKSFKDLHSTSKQMIPDGAPESIKRLFSWLEVSNSDLRDFMQLIEDSVDLDQVDETGEYVVKPESDDDLAKVVLDINSICAKARCELNNVAEDLELEANKHVKLETDPEKGFMLKVTKNNESVLRGNNRYQQISLVKKDGYRFTNQALSKLSIKYVDVKAEYNSLAKNLISDVIGRATTFHEEVLEFAMSVTVLDVFVTLSVVAAQNNYVRPLILDSDAEKIAIDRLRHPCIENQPDIENYVPNDIALSKDEKKFYMITGPNMGGKSTFIKSVAVGVIMASIGSMIPADDGRISVIDGVFTRVGAGDCQMEGISTFMEEMLDMSTILKEATRNSLVIIDELGRGTSTFDGLGLAWSISKHLATKTQCFTLFATHFHELTEMENEVKTVGNLQVRALCEDDKLTMLFSVDKGTCDESYGINVAKYVGFKEHVIEAAKKKLKMFEEVQGF